MISSPSSMRSTCSDTGGQIAAIAEVNASAGEASRRPGAHRLVPADQRESARQAAEGRVWSEVLLDLRDGGAAAQTGEMADQLDVGEVAGVKRSRLAAAVQA